jgi:5-methylcytosine-specific restriction endonuclease McrA
MKKDSMEPSEYTWWEQQKQKGTLSYWKKRAQYLNEHALDNHGLKTTLNGHQLQYKYVAAKKKCVYCSTELAPCDVHFDHIKPMSKGGKHTGRNIQVLCKACNLSEGAKATMNNEDVTGSRYCGLHHFASSICPYPLNWCDGKHVPDLVLGTDNSGVPDQPPCMYRIEGKCTHPNHPVSRTTYIRQIKNE